MSELAPGIPKQCAPLRECNCVVSDSRYWQVTDSLARESESTASWTIQSVMKTSNDISSFEVVVVMGERRRERRGRKEGKAYRAEFANPPRSRLSGCNHKGRSCGAAKRSRSHEIMQETAAESSAAASRCDECQNTRRRAGCLSWEKLTM